MKRFKLFTALLLTSFLFVCQAQAATIVQLSPDSFTTLVVGTVKDVTTLADWIAADADAGVTHITLSGVVGTLAAPFTTTKPIYAKKGTMITTNGNLLNLAGGFDAGVYRVFVTSGTEVLFTKATTPKMRSAWFGEIIDASSDTTALLQTAMDVHQNSGAVPIELTREGQYKVDTGIVLKQGANGADTMAYGVEIEGNDATLLPEDGVAALTITPRCALADIGTGRQQTKVKISRLNFSGFYAQADGSGLVLGAAGYRIDSAYKYSEISDCNFNWFTASTGKALYVLESRKFLFRNLYIYGTVTVEALTNGSFSGDHIFENCEFGAATGIIPLHLKSYSAVAIAEVRGIHFKDCVTYSSGTLIQASGTGKVADVWFDNCAWDGAVADAGVPVVWVNAGDTSWIVGVHINSPYMVSFNGPALTVEGQAGTTIDQISMENGQIGDTTIHAGVNSVIYAVNVDSISLLNNTIFRTTNLDASSSMILLYVVGRSNVIGNQSNGSISTVPNGISIIGASDHYMVIGNNMDVTTIVNDAATGAPTKYVTGNIN